MNTAGGVGRVHLQPTPDRAHRTGRIHSVESCGAVDGPGLRYVVFVQGCPLRCRYCHNPDTWDPRQGTEVTVGSLIEEIQSYVPYMKFSGGGVTVSGGEPLLQPDFVADLFAECRRLGIHTALDTSGFAPPERARRVLEQTDLVLLDIKHPNLLRHKALTGVDGRRPRTTARLAAAMGIPMWIRHVVVPGWTEDPADVEALADLVQTLPTVEKVELLPYHLLGKHKWDALGMPYALEGVEPPSEETMARIRQQLTDRGIRVG